MPATNLYQWILEEAQRLRIARRNTREHRRIANAILCFADSTPPGGSQHVLKAEAARPDATDCETPPHASPVGGPMGAGQPAAAGPAEVQA